MMRFVFVGAGAVGGYYGALLARAGHQVGFVARGAHRDAIARDGLRIASEAVGDFVAPVRADSDPSMLGRADVVVLAVKTYDNASAIPMLAPMVDAGTTVLTLQNGIDSAEELAAVVGEPRTIAGATYVATAIEAPGLIKQTGSHRRIVFGEYFGDRAAVSDRVARIAAAMTSADIHAEPVADVRPPIWEKFTYLAPFAAFTGAARLPIGPLWSDPHTRAMFLQAVAEVREVAAAHGVTLRPDHVEVVNDYLDKLPASTRSSLLIDLSQGKRIEVEALQGTVVRRGQRVGVATPVMSALYAVLKPWAEGSR
jgi:2-dehydropantoate 2-reductase